MALHAFVVGVPIARAQTGVAVPTDSSSEPQAGEATQLLIPIVHDGTVHGDVLADLYLDGRISFERLTLLVRLTPFLSADGRVTFDRLLVQSPMVSSDEVQRAGIELRYNPTRLEVVIADIDPTIAAVQQLGSVPPRNTLPVTLEPAGTSAYVNVIADFQFDEFTDGVGPGLLVTGAIRHRDIVFEFDGGYDRQVAQGSGFYRRYARLVYDEPDRLRRFTAGDVQVPTLGLLGGVFVGGVGVEKGRRVFNDFGPLTSLGGQQILLERDATVEVIVAGQQAELLQLRAGPYDLSRLRAEYSGRDTQLFITDVTGRRQLASFDTFLDPGALMAGETEYSAAIGVLPDSFDNQPNYGSSPAFSGFYSRGMNNRLTLGGALQISEEVQVAGAEMVVSPVLVPGRIELGAAVSVSEGTGIAARGSYSLRFGDIETARRFSIGAEYRDAGFTTITDRLFIRRADTFLLNANYSQRLDERTSLIVGANWFERGDFPAIRSIYADAVRSTRNYRLTLGVEYGDDFFARNFGVRASLSIPFGRSTRAEASYNSRRDDARAFVTRSYDDTVGSWGYDVGVRRSQGNQSLDASGTYIGNRFYARGFASTSGPGFGGITDNPSGRLQVGTSFAYADGLFGVGRPINDSFALATPNADLEDAEAVIGGSIQERRPEGISGIFGAALSNRLNSYNRQSIFYDLDGGGAGADIGTGVETVLPPYRSGYRLIVGSGATVTAYGFLNLPSGRAALVAGTITSSDDPDFGTQPFFTNSTGRFAILGLKQGYRYTIRLSDPVAEYVIEVPSDADTLLQLNEITIDAGNDEQER
ncbi:fimbria/pilus outer membrane usher protein [Pseudopontixanthobacter vadosimaris]|uniref:fimbria/pilus outer membrane usher protein n=1 Tax=Pseudopontixanthobacter vadosimaris TaxID=2726450 RepID=UPI0030B8AE4C